MDKWQEFKNYMHNDLNITREDIQSWLAEAIVQESRRIVKGHVDKIDVPSLLKLEITSMVTDRSGWGSNNGKLKKEFIDNISKEIASKIQVTV